MGLQVVLPTAPFPPTKTHFRDSCFGMFCTVPFDWSVISHNPFLSLSMLWMNESLNQYWYIIKEQQGKATHTRHNFLDIVKKKERTMVFAFLCVFFFLSGFAFVFRFQFRFQFQLQYEKRNLWTCFPILDSESKSWCHQRFKVQSLILDSGFVTLIVKSVRPSHHHKHPSQQLYTLTLHKAPISSTPKNANFPSFLRTHFPPIFHSSNSILIVLLLFINSCLQDGKYEDLVGVGTWCWGCHQVPPPCLFFS